jgi:hypothetical protein
MSSFSRSRSRQSVEQYRRLPIFSVTPQERHLYIFPPFGTVRLFSIILSIPNHMILALIDTEPLIHLYDFTPSFNWISKKCRKKTCKTGKSCAQEPINPNKNNHKKRLDLFIF